MNKEQALQRRAELEQDQANNAIMGHIINGALQENAILLKKLEDIETPSKD